MTHAAFHYSLGLLLGSALVLPGLARAWRARLRLAPWFARWLLMSHGLGIFAIVPSLLRNAGLPDAFCDGWWMNLFLAYPLVHRADLAGVGAGCALLAALLAAQYGTLLTAVRRVT